MRLFEGTQWDVPPRCDRCEELEADCQCPPLPDEPVIVPPEKQRLKIRVERRKRGKIVTVIAGLAVDDAVAGLLKDLKNSVGSGGSIQDENLEIQGDHADSIRQELKKRGYRVP